MSRRPPRSTRTDTLCPCTSLFRSRSYIMCRAMNRSFISVIAGGFGADDSGGAGGGAKEQRPWKPGSADDAAFLMSQAENVIIVPGYGMAVAQAQHALREMADLLKKEGVNVKYARSEEHTSELKSLMRNSYAVF